MLTSTENTDMLNWTRYKNKRCNPPFVSISKNRRFILSSTAAAKINSDYVLLAFANEGFIRIIPTTKTTGALKISHNENTISGIGFCRTFGIVPSQFRLPLQMVNHYFVIGPVMMYDEWLLSHVDPVISNSPSDEDRPKGRCPQ